jgi:hypothetical protein
MSMPIQNDRLLRFMEMTSAENEGATLEEMFQRMTCRVDGVEGALGRPEGLPAICAAWGVPYGRVMTWLMTNMDRWALYQRALEVCSHSFMGEVLDIADGDQFPQEKRVRLDARFRLAQFHAPRMYAPKQEVTHELGQSFTEALLEISRRREQDRVVATQPPAITDADGDPV